MGGRVSSHPFLFFVYLCTRYKLLYAMAKSRTKKKGNKICAAGIAWAKRTFDRYPSAYANMAASKYCKDPNYAKGKKKK